MFGKRKPTRAAPAPLEELMVTGEVPLINRPAAPKKLVDTNDPLVELARLVSQSEPHYRRTVPVVPDNALLAKQKRESKEHPRHACGRYCTHPEVMDSALIEACTKEKCPFKQEVSDIRDHIAENADNLLAHHPGPFDPPVRDKVAAFFEGWEPRS